MTNSHYDAVIVGSGPNGLSAAIQLAKAGKSVLVIEGKDTPGGGTRSAELTLPGFIHDVCSAMHPLGVASPFFRSLPLAQNGLEWVYSPSEVAHPLDDGTAVMTERSLVATSQGLGRDALAYRLLMGPHLSDWRSIVDQLLGPFRLPARPLSYAWFGLQALLPAALLAKIVFREQRAKAMFAGHAAHSMMPLEWPGTAGFGLMMALLGHAVGFPMARGGSQRIPDALIACLRSLGGEVVTGQWVDSLDALPDADQILFDLTPRQINRIAGKRLPRWYRRQLDHYRYGVGVFKVDFALDGPIPWKAKEVLRAATVHLGGTMEEIAAAERATWRGEHPERPFVLLAQQSLFDPTRAPQGKQTVWSYCHVPNGSTVDMTRQIEEQIERFAPGFRGRILAKHITNSREMEQYNPNYIGGDINGGVQDLRQFFTRPVARLIPYSTPNDRLYICSSSTPPGGGVHGMCGFYAAKAANTRHMVK